MKVEEALNLLKQICADFKGTLKDHQLIQQAIQVVEKECEKEVEVEKKT